MQQLPTMSGMQWIRSGFILLRRQPHELSMMFLVYVSVNVLGFSMLYQLQPTLAMLFIYLFNQILTTGFMLGTARVDADGHATPRALFTYFRAPALGPMTALGACYLLAVLVACLAAYLYLGGDMAETIVRTMGGSNAGNPNVDPAIRDLMFNATTIGSLVYMLLVFPFWFAGPLIAWQGMSLGKAIFFSTFSVLRSLKAFLAYFMAWAVISMFVLINLSALLALLHVGSSALTMAVLIPTLLFLNMLRYCSYYPSYVELFGKPQLPAHEDAPDARA